VQSATELWLGGLGFDLASRGSNWRSTVGGPCQPKFRGTMRPWALGVGVLNSAKYSNPRPQDQNLAILVGMRTRVRFRVTPPKHPPTLPGFFIPRQTSAAARFCGNPCPPSYRASPWFLPIPAGFSPRSPFICQ